MGGMHGIGDVGFAFGSETLYARFFDFSLFFETGFGFKRVSFINLLLLYIV